MSHVDPTPVPCSPIPRPLMVFTELSGQSCVCNPLLVVRLESVGGFQKGASAINIVFRQSTGAQIRDNAEFEFD